MTTYRKVYEPGDVIGEYRLTAQCGGGGFGQVFLAENTYSGFKVALKILFDARQGSKELEGLRAFQQCKNEHLIQIHHIGETDDGLLYYTMDRADNAGNEAEYKADSLDLRIRKGKISPNEVFDLAIHLAESLECLHQAGLIHRDVKPANIIYVGGKPVLADIGLVTNTERPDVSFAGTRGFLPKYVYAGHPQCRESDFFALGMVILCALTGQNDPVRASEYNRSMTLSGHSGDLQRLCATLEDGQDFDDVLIHDSRDFLKCLHGGDGKPETSPTPSSPHQWRKSALYLVLTLILTGALGYGLYHHRMQQSVSSAPSNKSARHNSTGRFAPEKAEDRARQESSPLVLSPVQPKDAAQMLKTSALGSGKENVRSGMIDIRDLQGYVLKKSADVVAEVAQMAAGLSEPYAGILFDVLYGEDYHYLPNALYDDIQKEMASWQNGKSPKSSKEMVDYLRAEKELRRVTEAFCRHGKNSKTKGRYLEKFLRVELIPTQYPHEKKTKTYDDLLDERVYYQVASHLTQRIFYIGILMDKDRQKYHFRMAESPDVQKLLNEFPLPEPLQTKLDRMGKNIPPLYRDLANCQADIQSATTALKNPFGITPNKLKALRKLLKKRADFAKKVQEAEKLLNEFPVPEPIQKRIDRKDPLCRTIINCNKKIDRELAIIGSSGYPKDQYSFPALRKQLERRAGCIELVLRNSTEGTSPRSQGANRERNHYFYGGIKVLPEAKLVLEKYDLSSYHNISMKEVKRETRDLLRQYDLSDDLKAFMAKNQEKCRSLYSLSHMIEAKTKRTLSRKDSDDMKCRFFMQYVNDLVHLLMERRDVATKLFEQNQSVLQETAGAASAKPRLEK